jgi:PAS domain S-box-containing protein
MKSQALRFRIATGLIAALVSLAIGLLFWQLRTWQVEERALALNATRQRAGQIAEAIADRTAVFVRNIDFALLEIRREYGVDEARFRAISDALLKMLPEGSLRQLGIAGPDGVLTYSNLGLSDRISVRDREHFKAHLAGGDRLFISKPVLGRVSGQWSIQFTRPILRKGRFAGVVVLSISPEYIGQLLAALEVSPLDNIGLLDADGSFLATSRNLADALGKALPRDRPLLAPQAPPQGAYEATSILDGVQRMYSWKRVRDTRLLVNVGLDKSAALAPIERHYRQSWESTVSLAAALFAFGAGIVVLLTRAARQQRALATSEAHFRAVFEQAAVGVGLLNARDGRWLRVNQKLCDIVGYSAEEMLALDFRAISHADDIAPHASFRRRMEAGEISNYTLEKRFLRRDGSVVWVNLSSSLMRDARGAPDYYVSIYEDVTGRKRIEERLAEINAALERRVAERTAEVHEQARIIEQIHDAVLTTDLEGRITSWNRGAERMFGSSSAEALGRNIRDYYAAEVRGVVNRWIRDASSTTGWYETETRMLRRDGTAFDILVSTSLLHDPDGAAKGYIGFGIDITERKRAEAALIEAKEIAERSSMAKSEFLSRMSHELRTPLNAILGFAQVLELDLADGRQREEVREILRAGEHLLQLISDLLDLSRIESGHLALSLEPVELASAVDAAVALVAPLLAPAGLTLDSRLGDCRSALVFADATRLRQVLVNLLSNAVKYNRPGGKIRLECAPGEAERIRIKVTDTGLGIAPERMGRLFEPFERLGAETSGVEGAGIGLALSKRLVEAMGGEIGASSVAGEGSTFWIKLPRSRVSPPEPPAARRAPLAHPEGRGLRVLYIEDNPANVRLVKQVLERLPRVALRVATRGEEGVGLASAETPDLILLDMHLPDIDGIEVLRRLRAAPRLAAVPVFAVSAAAMPRDVQRAQAAGAQRYFTKPINVAELMDAVRALMH